MGFFDFLFDLDGDGKVGADEEFINMMMLNHMEKEMREESSDIDDYDDDIDSFSYSDSQSNMPDTSWRDTCEDGFEYGLDPQDYDDEDEYLDALNEAKYEWRDFCDDEGYEYDVDPEDYETEDEYNAALHEAKYGWRDTCDDGSDYGMRAGTENVAQIVGMATALKDNCERIAENKRHIKRIEEVILQTMDSSGISYKRNGTHQIPGLLSLSFPNQDGEAILHRLDLHKICISTGSACDSVRTEISHVLKAIQLDNSFAKGTIRISFGVDNTEEDAKIIAAELIQIVK